MDDHDIKNIQLRSLREQIVLVPQDVVSTKYRFIPCFLFLVSSICNRGYSGCSIEKFNDAHKFLIFFGFMHALFFFFVLK